MLETSSTDGWSVQPDTSDWHVEDEAVGGGAEAMLDRLLRGEPSSPDR